MDDATPGEAWLEELTYEECLAHLREEAVGRLGIVVNEVPAILPVNYLLVETSSATWIALRTRPGNVIDSAPPRVAFEIDGVDRNRQEGWSVLVRGALQPVDPAAADFEKQFDAHPWLHERDAWLVIEPFAITGRQLHAAAGDWAFHPRAYL